MLSSAAAAAAAVAAVAAVAAAFSVTTLSGMHGVPCQTHKTPSEASAAPPCQCWQQLCTNQKQQQQQQQQQQQPQECQVSYGSTLCSTGMHHLHA
jgi:hypothetical protein